VAITENGRLIEVFHERRNRQGLVGNVYLGRVHRVLPGMHAAFLAIGLDRHAFLYVEDVLARALEREVETDENDDGEGGFESEPFRARIDDLVKEGQQIVVQVTKDPLSGKGPRVTANLSLPGRTLVFLPGAGEVAVSRRITDEGERERLRQILEAWGGTGGFIARTAAQGCSREELEADRQYLLALAERIGRKAEAGTAPMLLHRELELPLRVVRDLATADVAAIRVDEEPTRARLADFLAMVCPALVPRLELYDGTEPLFEHFGVETEIESALQSHVPLPSGGSVVIHQTEALVAIDVNTGKFVGKRNLEETITKNNLEACREVADQLRLRNIGGIIVVDFIDMDNQANREKVFRAFSEALKDDRARSNVSKISELGLVEMTRKRTRESLARKLTEPCFYCEGKGYLKSKTTICYEILREIRRGGDAIKDDTIVVQTHPEVAELLSTVDREHVEQAEKRLHKRVLVKGRPSYHMEQYDILGLGQAKKATEKSEKKKAAVAAPEEPEVPEVPEVKEEPEEVDGEEQAEARPTR
jgi:ribonuclease G